MNVGPREQWARLAVGSLALAAALSPRFGRMRWLLAGLGLMNVVTGALRYCPTNSLLGIDNTRGREFLHFAAGGRGRKLNRLQRRLGATV